MFSLYRPHSQWVTTVSPCLLSLIPRQSVYLTEGHHFHRRASDKADIRSTRKHIHVHVSQFFTQLGYHLTSKQMVEMCLQAIHSVGACVCHHQVGVMRYLEHNLSKCATIVQPTLQLLHRTAMFLQHLHSAKGCCLSSCSYLASFTPMNLTGTSLKHVKLPGTAFLSTSFDHCKL